MWVETSFSTQIVGYRVAMVGNEILYSRKYWPFLNLAVWPQTNPKKKKNLIWRWYLRSVYQGALPSLAWTKPQVCKFTRNKTGSMLVCSYMYSLCRGGALEGARSATACITPLHVACEIILADLTPLIWRGFTTEVWKQNSGNVCMPGCEGSTFTWHNHCLWRLSSVILHCTVVCPCNVPSIHRWVNGEHCLVGTRNRIN